MFVFRVYVAVSGCKDSYPISHTESCSPLGGSKLTLHGLGFLNTKTYVTEVAIGRSASCDEVKVLNDWSIQCVVRVQSPLSIESNRSYKIAIEVAG